MKNEATTITPSEEFTLESYALQECKKPVKPKAIPVKNTLKYYPPFRYAKKWQGGYFKGAAIGRIKIGECTASARTYYRSYVEGVAREFVNNIFHGDLAFMDASNAYRSVVKRLDDMRGYEDPFIILEAFLSEMRMADFEFDWKRRDSTDNKRRKQASRIFRGEIKGARKKKALNTVEIDEYEDWTPSISLRNGRNVYFPRYLEEDKLDAFIERHDLDFSLSGIMEGCKSFQLSAGDDGAWAIYLIKDGHYERTFSEVVKAFVSDVSLGFTKEELTSLADEMLSDDSGMDTKSQAMGLIAYRNNLMKENCHEKAQATA